MFQCIKLSEELYFLVRPQKRLELAFKEHQ